MLSVESYFSRQMKLRHLELLVALADLQTVSQVADVMRVTQPAVSKMLAEMEKGIGAPLFERDGRRIKPTLYGGCLIQHARRLLMHAQRAGEELRALHSGMGGRVEVGLLSVAAPILIPQAISLFKQSSPTETVGLHEGTLDQLIPALRVGRLDLIVGRVTDALIDRDLANEPLYDDPIVIVVARTHPIARGKRIRWSDLDGLAWIVPAASTPVHQGLISMLNARGVKMPINTVESVVIAANIGMLERCKMLGLLPRSLAQHHEQAGTLKILPLSLSPLMGPVGMTWSQENEATPVVSRFKACLREAAKTMRA